MNHGKKRRKLNRSSSHRKALLRNMAADLLLRERITTTVPKAKELRPFVEKLITRGRVDTLHNRRLVAKEINRPELVTKLFTTIADRFAERPGGYTRIVKAGYRYGDNAPMAVIAFVEGDFGSKEDDPD